MQSTWLIGPQNGAGGGEHEGSSDPDLLNGAQNLTLVVMI